MPADTRGLNQSLVLSVVLGRRGISNHVVIGVRGAGDSFGAQA